jgi:hypothetical protein
MYYRRFTNSLTDKGTLVPINKCNEYRQSLDANSEHYLSIYEYNEEQYQEFLKTGSVKGVEDVTTTRLVWDFDSVSLELAKADALELCGRLEEKGFNPDQLEIYFSGNKGFHVCVEIFDRINVDTFKNITYSLASDLKTYDKKISNPSRILRVVNTRHPSSGLYKVQFTAYGFLDANIEYIKYLATKIQPTFDWEPQNLPARLKNLSAPKVEKLQDKEFSLDDIDFSRKPKGWPNCKWAVLNGFQVQAGNRHDKLLCIVAQSKALNNTPEMAYYNAKLADENGVANYGGEKSSKEDIWTIVESVYDDSWKGGTYTCKNNKTVWLAEICQTLGPYKCKHNETENLIDVESVFKDFFTYAKDIEKNTIKTGIKDLDTQLRLLTGQMIGILGAPSSGKTAIALELLENTSRAGYLSVFYSLDMAKSELFQKIAMRVTGLPEDKLFYIFKNSKTDAEKIGQAVAAAYGNVKFCFDTGVSIEKVDETIGEFEEANPGKKVKLLLLDYNELLSSPYSDATAASGYNAGGMKKLTNSREICTISLLQPPKMVGDASCEINSYRNVKGSSLLEQCFSTIIGIYRPGFSAENNSADDVYMVMNVLKNRLGKLFNCQFYWDGLTGKIKSIDDTGREAIKDLKNKKKAEREGNDLGLS